MNHATSLMDSFLWSQNIFLLIAITLAEKRDDEYFLGKLSLDLMTLEKFGQVRPYLLTNNQALTTKKDDFSLKLWTSALCFNQNSIPK